MTHDQYSFLFDQAQQMDEPLLTEENVGESQRVHQKVHDDPNIQPSNASKKLLLGLGDNDLADEAEKYLQITFKSKLVYSAKVHSPLSSYVSLLKCIDNVPGYYSVEDFAREVFEMLVNTPNACAQKLGASHGQNYSFIQRSSSWLSQWK